MASPSDPAAKAARAVEPSPASPGLAARAIAVAAIVAVIDEGKALDATLDRLLAEPGGGLEPRDKALARAIATVGIRHFGAIRAIVNARLREGMPGDAGALGAILVAAIAQMLWLDVPDHAAVDLAVRAARADGKARRYSALCNAVLRRVARERGAILARLDPLADDTPPWLRERWIKAYGAPTAARIAAAHAHEAAVDLTVAGDPRPWVAPLDAVPLATGSLRLRARAPLDTLPGYAEGAWWVQDAAAALPVRLLRPRPGERIVDLCAAPGGKTAQLAAAGADVLAVDRSAARMARLKANMARLRLGVETRIVDALALEGRFDAVLLDAPCSATGTLRRHPDVAWTKTPQDLARLVALQARLLDKAAGLLAPGGRLVYCTCSLEPEEGEAHIEALLASLPAFRRDPVAADELPGLEGAITAQGDVRTLPFMLANADARLAGIDGFYIARLAHG